MGNIDWTATWTCILALVTLVNVLLVRRLMRETSKMAASTRDLAESSLRPDLIIHCPYYPPSELEIRYRASVRSTKPAHAEYPRVINTGAGPAKDVSINIGGSDSPIANVIPREGVAYHAELIKAQEQKQIVTIHYKDGMGNVYPPTSWIYEDEIRDWRVIGEGENDTH